MKCQIGGVQEHANHQSRFGSIEVTLDVRFFFFYLAIPSRSLLFYLRGTYHPFVHPSIHSHIIQHPSIPQPLCAGVSAYPQKTCPQLNDKPKQSPPTPMLNHNPVYPTPRRNLGSWVISNYSLDLVLIRSPVFLEEIVCIGLSW